MVSLCCFVFMFLCFFVPLFIGTVENGARPPRPKMIKTKAVDDVGNEPLVNDNKVILRCLYTGVLDG